MRFDAIGGVFRGQRRTADIIDVGIQLQRQACAHTHELRAPRGFPDRR
jgi:hypothetical protein